MEVTEVQMAMLRRIAEFPEPEEGLSAVERYSWGYPAGPRDRDVLDSLLRAGLVRRVFATFNYRLTANGRAAIERAGQC